MVNLFAEDPHLTFDLGDHVKFETRNEETGESEWMWLRVDYYDDSKRLVFGWLASDPIVFSAEVTLGQHFAVSYDNVREHKRPAASAKRSGVSFSGS